MYETILTEKIFDKTINKGFDRISEKIKELLNSYEPELKKLAEDLKKLALGVKIFAALVLAGIAAMIFLLIKIAKNTSKLKHEAVLKEGFSIKEISLFLLKPLLTISLLVGTIYTIIFTVSYIAKSKEDLHKNIVIKLLIDNCKRFLDKVAVKSQKNTNAKNKEKEDLKIEYLQKIIKTKIEPQIENTDAFYNQVQKFKNENTSKNEIVKFLSVYGKTIFTKESLKSVWSVFYLPFIALSSYLNITLPGSLQRLKKNLEKNNTEKKEEKEEKFSTEFLQKLEEKAMPDLRLYYLTSIAYFIRISNWKDSNIEQQFANEYDWLAHRPSLDWKKSKINDVLNDNPKLQDIVGEWGGKLHLQAKKDAATLTQWHFKNYEKTKNIFGDETKKEIPLVLVIKMCFNESVEKRIKMILANDYNLGA